MALSQATLDAIAAAVAAAMSAFTPTASVGVASSHWRTKAQRDAGDGFPCTVATPCKRRDLRTPESAASHNTKATHYHVAR